MLEDDLWEDLLEPYEANPAVAFAMAQTLATLHRILAQGSDGTQEVIQFLDNGIREIYQYTHFHQACFSLYQRAISPEGLLPQFDPIIIVDEIDKPEARTKRPVKKSKSGRRVRR